MLRSKNNSIPNKQYIMRLPRTKKMSAPGLAHDHTLFVCGKACIGRRGVGSGPWHASPPPHLISRSGKSRGEYPPHPQHHPCSLDTFQKMSVARVGSPAAYGVACIHGNDGVQPESNGRIATHVIKKLTGNPPGYILLRHILTKRGNNPNNIVF